MSTLIYDVCYVIILKVTNYVYQLTDSLIKQDSRNDKLHHLCFVDLSYSIIGMWACMHACIHTIVLRECRFHTAECLRCFAFMAYFECCSMFARLRGPTFIMSSYFHVVITNV